jgi:hypothetical protein
MTHVHPMPVVGAPFRRWCQPPADVSWCRAGWTREAAVGFGVALNQPGEEEPTMVRLTVRYARYLLATLSGVGFGANLN